MSTQKKVWGGVAVLLAVGVLLAQPITAYANRQREAARAEAQSARAREIEAAHWEAMGDYYQRQAALAAEEPAPVYDATGALQKALEGAKATPVPMPVVDWDAERARMTAMPGYSPLKP